MDGWLVVGWVVFWAFPTAINPVPYEVDDIKQFVSGSSRNLLSS